MAGLPLTSLAAQEWEAIYLLACRALPLTPGLERIGPSSGDTVDYIEFTSVDTPRSSGSEWAPTERLDSLRSRQVEAFGLRVKRVQDFAVLYIFVKLSSAGADGLLAERGLMGTDGKVAGYNRYLNKLLQKLAPEAYPHSPRDDNMPPHVLYFEPSHPLAPSLSDFLTSRDLAEAATDYPGLRHQFKTPVTLGDVMILPGGGYGQYKSHCTAIRWKPFAHHDTLTLAQIPLMILNHYVACQIKDELAAALRSLPVNGPAYREMFSNLRNFADYNSKYIGERAEAETLLLAASEAGSLPELRTDHVYGNSFQDFGKAFPWAGGPTDMYVQSMREVIWNERQRADRSLEQALHQVSERVRILDGFLRDAALADASSANLAVADRSARLASSVNVLTWVILLFTVVSVALSFIPQDVKEAPFRLVFKQGDSKNE